jgi:hypothetical protein
MLSITQGDRETALKQERQAMGHGGMPEFY